MPSYPDEPDIILPHFNQPPRLPKMRRVYILLAVLFFGFLLVQNAVPLYTDWLWFGEVGYRAVFTTTILAKTLLFCVFGGGFFLLFYLNTRYARRLAPEDADRFLMQNFGPQWGQMLQRGIGIILLVLAIFLSLWAGRLAAEYWSNYLEFTHATPFNIKDPVFGNDIGFYIFRLPFLRLLWQFGFISLIVTTVAVVAIHYADRAIETISGLPDVAPKVKAHLFALLAALAATRAIGYRLNAYDLLTTENGVFTGAGYADLHYRLFALNAQMVLLGLTALACLVAIRQAKAFRWALTGAGVWLAAVLLLGGAIPAAMQKIYVEPNQFSAEKDYIARNIQFTRQGFGLENVRRVDSFPADESLTATGLKANRDTLDNVRLWDYEYLSRVYGQTQIVKNYYKFEKINPDEQRVNNIDIDRYVIGGRLRQVMLAAREMDSGNASQTWQNRRLSYTHGYGLVMSPVNKIIQGGPDYFLQGFPPTTSAEARGLEVKRPEIYFGQLGYDHVYVDTTQQEFDYPSSDTAGANGAASTQDHYTNYAGRGGIRIGDAPLVKLAFSLRLGDANLLLAQGFKPSTRVLFRRDIRERVQTVAPFVQQDGDPYIVIMPEGRLVWIIDCYTLSDRYPYSTPISMGVNDVAEIRPNYVRNSIKATVDAYDGSVNLYVADDKDPIAQTYSKIFPGLLKPLSALPAGLKAHLRYPEDLFRIQRSVYATYHVDDPRVFYLKEDAWAIPLEPNNSSGTSSSAPDTQMEPYYVIMRLPDIGNSGGEGEKGRRGEGENPDTRHPTPDTQFPNAQHPTPPKSGEEFLLMSPLAPFKREKQNILGWMCARCDGDQYGQLVLYRFPQKASVNGPSQVVSLFNSDKTISPQLTLLRQGGSAANFGNLLVIPIENSLLYIAPLYVEAANSRLPQLQRVAVAFGNKVALADTLDEALAQLFPGYNGTTTPESQQPTTTPTNPQSEIQNPKSNVPTAFRSLIEKANTQYEDAQKKLRSGDFAAYGEATKALERTLKELNRAAGGK